jgi:hypothetical protein
VKLEAGRKLEGCHTHAKEKWISAKKIQSFDKRFKVSD